MFYSYIIDMNFITLPASWFVTARPKPFDHNDVHFLFTDRRWK